MFSSKMEMEKKHIAKFQIFLILLYTVSVVIYCYLIFSGTDFYFTAFKERPRHPEYRILRPAGLTGHAFGIIGSMMMILMLLYSLRKRTRIFGNSGTLPHWLQIHIYLGIFGPLLVILHSSFKIQGLIAVSFWSMIAVALSGIFGRYLYLQIPRTISGKELDLDELNEMNKRLNLDLQQDYQLEQVDIQRIESMLFGKKKYSQNTIALLLSLFLSDLIWPFRHNSLKKKIAAAFHIQADRLKELIKGIREKELLERRISLWSKIQELFHYWHVIHKPFAVIMYLIMLVHILIAIYTGYVWIF